MRIMIFSETKTQNEIQNEIDYLENKLYAKVDYFNDYELAEYCMDIRTYDVIYFEYLPKFDKSYYNFLGYIKNKEVTPKVYLMKSSNEKESTIVKSFISNYDFLEITFIDKINFVEHIEKTLSCAEENILIRDNIHIDLKDKKIFFEKDGELKEIQFKKKFDFYVLLYFMRHYKSTININSLLDATCSEPEFTKDSIIESSISSIRKSFKEILDINPIKAFKKVGYRFSISDEGN